jgi:xylulokinase
MSQYLLAHDLGTSGDKATLFDTDGNIIASSVNSYPAHYFNNTWHEQEPEDWWGAVCKGTREVLEGIDAGDIAAVSFSGQMMGVVAVDNAGEVVRSAIIWSDTRSNDQARQLEDALGMKGIYEITGHRPSSSYCLEKLMWIRDEQPDIYARTYKSLCCKDYIIMKLTGKFVTDPSDASGTNAFDLNTFEWSDEILNAAGIDKDKMPDVLASTDVAGTVTAEASRQCGLKEGTPVVVGGGDGACASVGAGSVRPGITYNCLGTASWVSSTTEAPIYDENMMLFNFAHLVPGLVAPMGTMQAAGASFTWAINKFYSREELESPQKFDIINGGIAEAPVGANGVVFLPYLSGERAPRWNPNARGAFIGLKMDTTREDMMRAVLEGIAMNLNVILKGIREHAPVSDTVTTIGGFAQSGVLRQILADVFGMPIAKPNLIEEATSLGAAVAGGVGVGALPGFDSVNDFFKIEERESFDAERHARYEEVQKVFDKSYFSLLDTYEEIVKL